MSSFRSFSVVLVLIVVFLLSISIVTYDHLNSFISDAVWVNHKSRILIKLENVISSLKDAQTAHRGYNLTNDSSYLTPYYNTRPLTMEYIADLDSLTLGSEIQMQRVDTLRSLVVRQYNIMEEILSRKSSKIGLDNYAMALLKFDDENLTKLRLLVDRMADEENILLDDRTSSQHYFGRITPVFILISSLSAIMAVIYLFIQLYKTLKIKIATEVELEHNLKLLSEEVGKKEVAQESLQKVLDSSKNAILFLSAIKKEGTIMDFYFELCNKQVEEVLGFNLEHIIGKTLHQVFPGQTKSGLLQEYIDVVDKGAILDKEILYDHQESQKWLRVIAVKLDEGCVVTFSDITQSKKYEQDLVIKNQELKESNQNLEQFAYVASHDLQEPLRKIRAFGDRLVTKYDEVIDDKGKDYIDRMNSAASRMQDLIDDLLKYSRIARSPRPFEYIELEPFVKEILSDFEATIKEKNVEITLSGLGRIQADPLQLRQLFHNLISNAIKFSSHNNKPKVQILGKRIKGTSLKGLFDVVNGNRYFMKVEVIDNGIGFDSSYTNRIFKIFERLHGRNEFSGTGIGLAICQKVIQNHSGFITAKSESGKGANFIVALPTKQYVKSKI